MAGCHFLTLPRELRDSIFEYAISDSCREDDKATSLRCKVKRLVTGNERWEWNIQYASKAPTSTYLSLTLCNRQLRYETKEFLEIVRGHQDAPAKMTLTMAYPDLTPQWDHIPGPPDSTSALDILVKVDHMYHPAFMTHGAHNAILKSIFEMLKRYIHRGPHLARPSPLRQLLELDTARVTLAPPVPFEDMTYVYGFPAQQLETLFTEFLALMMRLARSGVPFGSISAFEVRLEGKDWHRIPVTSNSWDEEDFTFFQCGGYQWGDDDPETW